MKLTITSIELSSPLKFFALSYRALNIVRQLKTSPCVSRKTIGFWTSHYTMTLWKSEEDLKTFAKTGAHLEAMKAGASLAKEIRTLTIDADSFPDWKQAKHLLKTQGKAITY